MTRSLSSLNSSRAVGKTRVVRPRKIAKLSLLGTKLAIGALIGLGFPFPQVPVSFAETNVVETGITEDTYRLGISDKVRVQVFEWRPARDEMFSWTALNQVYSVDSAGAVTLPLIGQVSAAGYTTEELGVLISRKLAKRLNLATLPDATVEVAEYRPIFVIGHVEKAGNFPYTPGMTVLQGVSLGGGHYRNDFANSLRLEREFMSVSGEHTRLMQERQRLVVRKARLEAELIQADRIAFQAELRSVSRRTNTSEFLASLMAKEQRVFELRRKANETQLTALKQLQEFLEQEVESFGKRLAAHQEQVDLMKAELNGIKSLSDKGLATQPRVLGLRRNIAQLEGEKLRMESERTRAKQELSRVILSKIEFDNKRSNDLTIELQQTEARLEQVVQEADVKEQLLLETRAQAASSPLRMASTGSNSMPASKVTYTIVRQIKDGVIEIEATEATPLLPGDTVKVVSSVPSSAVHDNFIGASDKRELAVPTTPAADRFIPAPNLPVPDHASVEPVRAGTLQQ